VADIGRLGLLKLEGLGEHEVNLLQGRIRVSIFIRHYWSSKLTELRDRIFKVLETQPALTTNFSVAS
jgi:hypothetical protein